MLDSEISFGGVRTESPNVLVGSFAIRSDSRYKECLPTDYGNVEQTEDVRDLEIYKMNE